MNVTLALLNARLPLGPGVEVVAAHPSGLIALSKPDGVMSHPNKGRGKSRSLLQADYDEESEVYTWTASDSTSQRLHLLNRLDSPTSGVMLASTDDAVAAAVRAAFASHHVRKTYLAVVKGQPVPPHGVWRDKIQRQRTGEGHVRTRPGAVLGAQTQYRLRQAQTRGHGLSLLELSPLTGRTHQLRVQCSLHRCGILGDKTYGDFSFNRRVFAAGVPDRLYLHAERIALHVQVNGTTIHFEAEVPVPALFQTVVQGGTTATPPHAPRR
jgi:tRNA pseudouridine65 synthase